MATMSPYFEKRFYPDGDQGDAVDCVILDDIDADEFSDFISAVHNFDDPVNGNPTCGTRS